MSEGRSLLPWPVLRQLTGKDFLGRGAAAKSRTTERIEPRTSTADRVARSVCPYCAVGCGQVVYTRRGELVDIEGHPRSPINQGPLCPKGSASRRSPILKPYMISVASRRNSTRCSIPRRVRRSWRRG